MTHLSITKGKLIFVIVALICLIAVSFILREKQDEAVVKEQIIIQEHNVERFFDEYLFQRGVAETENTKPTQGKILGAIVPHHLIPSFIIADIFERIASQGIQTIILLSPNHYDIGTTPILTSEIAWNTPYGEVLPHSNIIQKLTQKDYISVDEEILDNEHGIAGLLPFIKYYSDEIKIVPLILRQNLTEEQIGDVSKTIADVIDDDTVIVASVDFSHYFTSDEAEQKNEESIKVIEKRDYDKLLEMNSDNLDSPEAISILLQTVDKIGTKHLQMLHNTNSGKLMDDLYGETTSYFGIIFTE